MAEYIVHQGIRIAKEFVPETFGRLTTLGPMFLLPISTKAKKAYQVCACLCGEYAIIRTNNLRTGGATNCGCVRSEKVTQRNMADNPARSVHGMAGTPTYLSYMGMIGRCTATNPMPAYEDVFVCSRWEYQEDGSGLFRFIEDVGIRPSLLHSIDRYPNREGNYEPGNVRWATDEEQQNNTSTNIWLTWEGKIMTVAQWAREIGCRPGLLYMRIKAGWDTEDTLTLPTGTKRKNKLA